MFRYPDAKVKKHHSQIYTTPTIHDTIFPNKPGITYSL